MWNLQFTFFEADESEWEREREMDRKDLHKTHSETKKKRKEKS